MLDELRARQLTTASRSQPANWLSIASGISGIHYDVSFTARGRARTELYIARDEARLNKALLKALQTERDAIERDFGASLSWELLERKRASRVASYRPGSITDPPEVLEEIRRWHIQQLLKFREVFGPRLPAVVAEVDKSARSVDDTEQGIIRKDARGV